MFGNKKLEALYKFLGLKYNSNWGEVGLAGRFIDAFARQRDIVRLTNDLNAIQDYLGIRIKYSSAGEENIVRTVVKADEVVATTGTGCVAADTSAKPRGR